MRGEDGWFVVRARATSIHRAREVVEASFPGSEVEVVFPIDGEGFFSRSAGVEGLESPIVEVAAAG